VDKETFAYLSIYKDSLSEDTEIEKAESLISYFRANNTKIHTQRGFHKADFFVGKTPHKAAVLFVKQV